MYFIGGMFTILIILLVAIFALGLPILAGVLVYRDASKRVDCSPWLWALVAALVPSFIGVVVYLIIRRDYPLKTAQNFYQNSRTGQQTGSHAQYSSQYADAEGNPYQYNAPEKTGLPTWAKALIIIVSVIAVICFIALIISVVKTIIGYATMYGGASYYNAF